MPEESDLLYIAKEGLLADLPDDWEVEELAASGEIMYINKRTKEKSLDHPCDEYFRQKVITERKRKIKNIKGLTKIDIPKSKTSFVASVFKREEEDSARSPGSMFKRSEGNMLLYNDEDSEPEKVNKDQRQRKKRDGRSSAQNKEPSSQE